MTTLWWPLAGRAQAATVRKQPPPRAVADVQRVAIASGDRRNRAISSSKVTSFKCTTFTTSTRGGPDLLALGRHAQVGGQPALLHVFERRDDPVDVTALMESTMAS